ncbi:hypothetical protein A6R68_03508 [Neotoma lepida]|uniref:Receptor ligand binding region domain-containing protein n=1 Tax=Neotoma lepida TaxID=56216 RepID=A0A1A6GRG4_NEOLE|nr:hypothetical protein A6R68_03508 [Neotoma lepida]
MALKDTFLALAMVSLMLHFSWNCTRLAISDNDQGTQFLSYLGREMGKNTVCFTFVSMIPVNVQLYMSRVEVYYNQIMTSSAKVVIIYGIQRIWVTNSQWDITSKRDYTRLIPWDSKFCK